MAAKTSAVGAFVLYFQIVSILLFCVPYTKCSSMVESWLSLTVKRLEQETAWDVAKGIRVHCARLERRSADSDGPTCSWTAEESEGLAVDWSCEKVFMQTNGDCVSDFLSSVVGWQSASIFTQ